MVRGGGRGRGRKEDEGNGLRDEWWRGDQATEGPEPPCQPVAGWDQ